VGSQFGPCGDRNIDVTPNTMVDNRSTDMFYSIPDKTASRDKTVISTVSTLKGAVHSYLNRAILLHDVTPDGKTE